MKIEKIHLNKIKVTFSPEDLIEHNITPEAVKNNAPWIQQVLMNAIRKAEEETGFSAQNARLMVEALPGEDDSMVMYITKLESEDDLKSAMRLAKGKVKLKVKNKATAPLFACVTFSDIEDAICLAKMLKDEDGGELYFYNNCYHLIISTSASAHICEFGKVTTDDYTSSFVKEHGTLVCTNALKTLRGYF